ncbi:ABC transporter ATP-binding protein [Alicyclobacillus tolerans]|uniref:ABC transporter ATP-binding protein n=1 Tax=Alicyclobacillus tolerans TaxID=90970 RepID=UPI001F421A01|nr:ABC transporter ATP-binding protein [Alicyclobacillus tolerans]MCF8565581.1 ABC transporter ATP-binding protein [Alicyclobacillus tolerans]
MSKLVVENIAAFYGRAQALRSVSLEVNPGETVALLGANGAGKTTTLKVISGLVKATQGKVTFGDVELTGKSPEKIIGMGIAHVPEGRHLFPGLTVRENLYLGGAVRKLSRKQLNEELDRVMEYFPALIQHLDRPAWALSGGQQQMVAVGRGLMAAPKVLLLDEPSLGLAPIIVKQLFQTIAKIAKEGTTILLVEQNAPMAFSVSQRAYVIETGKVTVHDTVENLRSNQAVQNAYLGLGGVETAAESEQSG